MAQDEDFQKLLNKGFTPGANSPAPDIAPATPPLSKTDATGELLRQLHKDSSTGVVNYQNGQGTITHKGTTLGFALRENQGQVQVALDPIPDGLTRGKLGDYRDTINTLHKTLGRPEVNITFVDQLSGRSYGHQIPVLESKVVELTEKLQTNQHQVNQIIGAFATGDQKIIQHTLMGQQAAATSGQAELNALLEKPFRPTEHGTSGEVAEGQKAFQDLLHSPVGKSQAGHADVKVLTATAGLMGIAATGAKAALTHLAPGGVESVMQAARVDEVTEMADRHLNTGRLNQAQHEIIQQYTTEHAVAVSAASLAPDPTGLSSDYVAKKGDESLVERLVSAGLPEQQAKEYRLGSLLDSVEEGSQMAKGYFAARQAVRQEMAEHGHVPLSLALHIQPEQLQALGELSNRLGDKLLQREISDHPDFKALAHLPPEQIGQLARLSAAGLDPKVQVLDGEISTMSQRPRQLSENPKQAFAEAATYVLQSGDHQYRASSTSPITVQATVAAFGKLYQDLAHDGGLSTQDTKALVLAMNSVAQGFDHPQQLQGVVANYTGGQQVSQQSVQENEMQLSH